jgi:predicted kinase
VSDEAEVAQTVCAMCGVAFSGKSSAARIVAGELGAELISLDAINAERGLSGGEGMTDAQWEETSVIAMERLGALLRQGRSAVVDDTFSHRFLRDRCKRVAEQHGCGFTILLMDTPLAVIEARREANRRNPTRHHVRDEVFAHHRDRFQFPSDDEPVVRLASAADLARWLGSRKGRQS